jgi:hypothetical protein
LDRLRAANQTQNSYRSAHLESVSKTRLLY